jgi:tagatose-1,6-bisphosphate aldolase non-catalytic subunit AgaZ/GatZ
MLRTSLLARSVLVSPRRWRSRRTGQARSHRDELVSRYVDARGGLQKIHALQSLRQTGHVTGPRAGERS